MEFDCSSMEVKKTSMTFLLYVVKCKRICILLELWYSAILMSFVTGGGRGEEEVTCIRDMGMWLELGKESCLQICTMAVSKYLGLSSPPMPNSSSSVTNSILMATATVPPSTGSRGHVAWWG